MTFISLVFNWIVRVVPLCLWFVEFLVRIPSRYAVQLVAGIAPASVSRSVLMCGLDG